MEEIIIPIDELPVNGLPEYRLGYEASKFLDEYYKDLKESEIETSIEFYEKGSRKFNDKWFIYLWRHR